MKKNLLLLFAGITLVFSACESSTPEEEALNDAKHDAEQIEDGQADGVIEFNDGIVAHIDMGELQLAKLMDLDEADVSVDEMNAAVQEAKIDIADRIYALENLTPTGVGGADFLSAAIDHLDKVSLVVHVYGNFAAELETPDSLWTEEMGTAWMNMAEPSFADYEDSYELLEIEQSNYGSLNNMDIIPSDVTIEEMYEESK